MEKLILSICINDKCGRIKNTWSLTQDVDNLICVYVNGSLVNTITSNSRISKNHCSRILNKEIENYNEGKKREYKKKNKKKKCYSFNKIPNYRRMLEYV